MLVRVQGNTTIYAVVLQSLTFHSDGRKEVSSYEVSESDAVRVILHGADGSHEYTPTIEGNVLRFSDEKGALSVGSYDVEVLITTAVGEELRSQQRGALLVVDAEQDAAAFGAETYITPQMFYFAGNDVTKADFDALKADVQALKDTITAQIKVIESNTQRLTNVERGFNDITAAFMLLQMKTNDIDDRLRLTSLDSMFTSQDLTLYETVNAAEMSWFGNEGTHQTFKAQISYRRAKNGGLLMFTVPQNDGAKAVQYVMRLQDGKRTLFSRTLTFNGGGYVTSGKRDIQDLNIDI